MMKETAMTLRTFALLCLLGHGLAAQADPSQPLVINGCGIWPHAQCQGADLRHADLVGKNLAGSGLPSRAALAR